jgi:tyrosyl-tRNA synthetase
MDKIEEVLTRGVVEILPNKEGLAQLMRQKKIRVYNGIDPTSPNIHLGNTIPLLKLRQLQELGHEVILLAGTFTAQIGDPSGHDESRKPLTREEIKKNLETYKQQAAKILDFSKVKLVFNGDWLEKMTFSDVIKLSMNFTVQQIIERDLFQRRLKKNNPIGLNEFLYPLAQGYDSVHLNVDLEIGGTDQTFNMLIGRTLQKIYNHKEKFVLTLPLIPGLDGRKMSKTYGNTVNITDSSDEMYGKLMSLRDDLIIQYLELCTLLPLQLIKSLAKDLKPMDLKKKLAFEIVKMYHSEKEAQKAQENFEKVFQKKELPKEVPIHNTPKTTHNAVDLLLEANLVKSRSEAKRLITQGGVDIDGFPINSFTSQITVKDGSIIKVGKRKFVKIHLV